MKTTSPRNCTIAQPWTPYSWWRRFLRDRSKYQLWSWMGSWSTGFSWPCSSATWKVGKEACYNTPVLQDDQDVHGVACARIPHRAACTTRSDTRVIRKVWILYSVLVCQGYITSFPPASQICCKGGYGTLKSFQCTQERRNGVKVTHAHNRNFSYVRSFLLHYSST